MKEGKLTRKKVKVIGKAEYVNNQTGELEVMNVISVEERDFNFHKLWLKNILQTIDLIGNQKVKIAFHIIENLNSDNQFIGTFRKIAKDMDTSTDTVKKTIDAMIEADFLRRVQTGVYTVNPEILYKGSRSGRMNILIQYKELKKSITEI